MIKQVFIITGLIILTCGFAFGQDKFVDDVYIATSDPGNNPLTGGVWLPYAGQVINVNNGQNLWIGVENLYDAGRTKTLRVTLTGTNVNGHAYTATGFDASGNSGDITATVIGQIAFDANTVQVTFTFSPQPQWEVIRLTAASNISIEEIDATSYCRAPVPSLTQWGIMALVLILIGSSVFVIYRRRKAVAA